MTRFAALWRKGVPIQVIADEFGVTPAALYKWARRDGLGPKTPARGRRYNTRKFRQDWKGKKPLRVLADEYGVTIATLHGAAMRRGLPHRRTIGVE